DDDLLARVRGRILRYELPLAFGDRLVIGLVAGRDCGGDHRCRGCEWLHGLPRTEYSDHHGYAGKKCRCDADDAERDPGRLGATAGRIPAVRFERIMLLAHSHHHRSAPSSNERLPKL